jgi:hypothetical protein
MKSTAAIGIGATRFGDGRDPGRDHRSALLVCMVVAGTLVAAGCGDDDDAGWADVDGAPDVTGDGDTDAGDGGGRDDAAEVESDGTPADAPPDDGGPPPRLCLVGYSEYNIVTYDNGWARHEEYLDRLASRGLNLVRTWAPGYGNWEHDETDTCGGDWFETLPWRRSGPGGKYDLRDFNPEFFERLRTFVDHARSRGIWIELTLFDSWALKHVGDWSWNPWDDDYNVNGVIAATGSCGVHRQFFDLANESLTTILRDYVQRVVRETAEFDNVIYEIMNEPQVCPEDAVVAEMIAWHEAVIGWIRAVRPGALIAVDSGPGGALLSLDYDFVCPHYGGWGDRTGTTRIPDLLGELASVDKQVIVDDDGCSHRDAEGNMIRQIPEFQRSWSTTAVSNAASYNHLEDRLYCNFFDLPTDAMLDALGAAVALCED